MSRLLVREKVFSMTGKDFEVKNSFFSGPAYTIEGDYSSPHDKKTLFDDKGRGIYRMKSKILTAKRVMKIKDTQSGSTVATLQRQGLVPIVVQGSGTVDVWRGDKTAVNPQFQISGAKDGSEFVITDLWKGIEAATVKKKSFTMATIVLGKASYMLEVSPGYDETLMIMLNIAIDDYF